ncbi:MAG TPA: hypothetical protein VHC92_08430, partial [Rhodanobacteraceae bacterium]|nr:hypothetical protein [Rhodanobacteraceae bacterium]
MNREQPINISTPPGFNYQVQGGNGSLSVDTEGWLFCANVSSDTATTSAVTVVPQHGDWRLPVAQDVSTVNYRGGTLFVNHNAQSTLVCHGVGAHGETSSPLTEGLFRNAFESKTTEQYSNLVNWIPSQGFDWSQPNWSLVP